MVPAFASKSTFVDPAGVSRGNGSYVTGRVEWRGVALLLLTLAFSVAVIWYFHDRFWWPVDEGIYGYVAQRINAGDVLNRDIIDLHAGYINLTNALALRLFGEDMLSMRYPLAGITLLQVVFVSLLFLPRGAGSAATAALVATAFSFVLFINPSANWYALFFFFATVWLLVRLDASRVGSAILFGLMIGLCFLFRQVSGVLLAMGVLTWLLIAPLSTTATMHRPRLAPLLLVIMMLGLCGYLWSKASLGGFLLFGIWPIAVLVMVLRGGLIDDRAAAIMLVRLAVGVVLATAPLTAYHLLTGSLEAWLRDGVFGAISFYYQQPFMSQPSFLWLAASGLAGIAHGKDIAAICNGILWVLLLAAPTMLGGLVISNMARASRTVTLHPLPFVATFFSLVAIHYQIPNYLWHGIAPVLLGLLWYGSERRPRASAIALLSLSLVVLIYQAGQPVSRGWSGTVRGERVELDAPEGLPRAHLKIERTDQRIYQSLLDRIETEARPDEGLFTVPMNPEFNFLTGRPSPTRYFGTPIGVTNDADVEDTLRRLQEAAPIFVIHRRHDKYFTPFSRDVLERIKRLAPPPETFGPFDLYRVPVK